MRTNESLIIAIIILSLIISAYFYSGMPESIASHWDIVGEVDGYMPKFWGLFLLPIILILSLLSVIMIPNIDPLRANIQKFRTYYDTFSVILALFLFYIYLLTILWNLGTKFNMMQLMAPAFAILLYYSGILTENARRNWFIGIQTPWTLSSERVWNKTHKLGGKLFKAAGVIALFGMFFPSYASLTLVVPVIVFSAYAVVYSYLEYRRETRH